LGVLERKDSFLGLPGWHIHCVNRPADAALFPFGTGRSGRSTHQVGEAWMTGSIDNGSRPAVIPVTLASHLFLTSFTHSDASNGHAAASHAAVSA
jgi:hypothetical protein